MSLRLGLIGHPVKHSLSPAIHQAALSFFGLAGSYELLDIEKNNLESSFVSLKKNGFSGVNITVPHKELVYKLATKLTTEAELVGAVNTLRLDSEGLIHAHNTDLGGFMNALTESLSRKAGNNALIIGSGGVARACLYGLVLCGFTGIDIIARNSTTAKKLIEDFQKRESDLALSKKIMFKIIAPEEALNTTNKGNAMINCTPLGLDDKDVPAWILPLLKSCPPDCIFFDTVYKKELALSPLANMALNVGLKSIDGRRMLAEQALLSFEFWTGKRPPLSLLLNAIKC